MVFKDLLEPWTFYRVYRGFRRDEVLYKGSSLIRCDLFLSGF
jgi:hypothetical protein